MNYANKYKYDWNASETMWMSYSISEKYINIEKSNKKMLHARELGSERDFLFSILALSPCIVELEINDTDDV